MDGAAAQAPAPQPQFFVLSDAQFQQLVAARGGANANAGQPEVGAVMAKEFMDARHPWIRSARESVAAITAQAARGRTEQSMKMFLVRLLLQHAYRTDVGMQELYAAFDPDNRSFWDAATKVLAIDQAIRAHNQRVCLQAMDAEEGPVAEFTEIAKRMAPAVHLLKQPLLPWAAVAMSDVAANYQTQLMESTCQMAALVRDAMPGGVPSMIPGVTGGAAAAAFAPVSMTISMAPPPSPFQEDEKKKNVGRHAGEASGGAPFAPIVMAPDGTQATDLGVLNEYLVDLEKRIGVALAHAECRHKLEDILKRALAAKSGTPAPAVMQHHRGPFDKRGPVRGGEAAVDKKEKAEPGKPPANF